MKKTLFLIVGCLIASMTINAQDLKLDEILKKHFEVGGQDKMSQLKTMKMVAKVAVMGMEMPMTMMKKRPDKMRSEVEFQGSKMIQTYNGKEGYMINPFTGSTEAQKVGDDQIGQLKGNANMDDPLFNFKEKGNQLELIGKEDVNGAATYKLKYTEKATTEGQQEKPKYFFIDCSNFNIVKSTSTTNMQGVDTDVEIFLSNYKDVEGVLMPFLIETKAAGNTFSTITFEEIKINEEMADALFEKPTSN